MTPDEQTALRRAWDEFYAGIEQMRVRATQLPKDSPEHACWIALAIAFDQMFELCRRDPEEAGKIAELCKTFLEKIQFVLRHKPSAD